MRERWGSTRVLTILGVVAAAAFLALTAQLVSPAGNAAAALPADGDGTCEMQITKTNNTGGDVDEGDDFTWRLEIEWDDDCNGVSFEVSDNIPSGFDVESVSDGSNISCNSSDPVECDGTATSSPGSTFVNIRVEADGNACGDRKNTAHLDFGPDDSDTDTVDVDCDGDDERDRVVIVRNVPVLVPQVAVPAIAPAPAPPPTAVLAAAPAPAPAPAQIQLPRAGEGPGRQSANSMLPISAGLLVVAGIGGFAYLRLRRFN